MGISTYEYPRDRKVSAYLEVDADGGAEGGLELGVTEAVNEAALADPRVSHEHHLKDALRGRGNHLLQGQGRYVTLLYN